MFHDSQILIDTPMEWNQVALPSTTGANLISYNNFNNFVMLDSPVSYNGRIVPDSNYSLISNSSILPVFTYNSFPFINFDTQNWRASAYKILNCTPFNLPPVLVSGLITKAKFGNANEPISNSTIAMNGLIIPLQSGTRYMYGTIGATTGGGGIRKWGWA